jgi:hypothetical protein
MSRPPPICRATASSPSRRARFFVSNIWTDVLCIKSITSRNRRNFLNRRRLTKNLRNLGGPSLTKVGRRIKPPRKGREDVMDLWHNQVKMQEKWRSIHHFLHGSAVGMGIGLIIQRIQRTSKATLGN